MPFPRVSGRTAGAGEMAGKGNPGEHREVWYVPTGPIDTRPHLLKILLLSWHTCSPAHGSMMLVSLGTFYLQALSTAETLLSPLPLLHSIPHCETKVFPGRRPPHWVVGTCMPYSCILPFLPVTSLDGSAFPPEPPICTTAADHRSSKC